MHLQVLVRELGERDRPPSTARAKPVEHLTQRFLGLCTCREPTHLWPFGAATFEPVPVRPQRLPVRALRLQLEHLPLLDHHKPPRSDNGSRNLAKPEVLTSDTARLADTGDLCEPQEWRRGASTDGQ